MNELKSGIGNDPDDDEVESLREGQRYFDSAALNSTLPEVMTHAEIVERNRALWRQSGDADAER